MGILPLVYDMPVRFTQTEDREKGVYKNSRGRYLGMLLPEQEKRRLDEAEDPELVLRLRPTHLLIYVETATAKMPNDHGEKVYALPVKSRVWSRDAAGNAKVRRTGFPIVPDFGGTAHAFCGDTLKASIGDLLAWHRRDCEHQRGSHVFRGDCVML